MNNSCYELTLDLSAFYMFNLKSKMSQNIRIISKCKYQVDIGEFLNICVITRSKNFLSKFFGSTNSVIIEYSQNHFIVADHRFSGKN